MSVRIPLDVQLHIIKRVPVKSLIRFRLVSKEWNSLIVSSKFIAAYNAIADHTQPQRLSVMYNYWIDYQRRLVSIIDDDTFPLHLFSITVPVSFKYSKVIGCSHGLFCFYDYWYPYEPHRNRRTDPDNAVIWNPSIKRSSAIDVRKVLGPAYRNVLGFAVVCNDVKIVKITEIRHEGKIENTSSIPWQVEVFTLSSGTWRNPLCSSNLPRKSIKFIDTEVTVDGCMYWDAFDRVKTNGLFQTYNMIISFDMTSEEFTEIHLPDCLKHQARTNFYISKQRESLVVHEYYDEHTINTLNVWKLGHDVPKSFTKLFTIKAQDALNTIKLCGFRNNGETLLEMMNDDGTKPSTFGVYDQCSKHIRCLGIFPEPDTLFVSSYVENLLLLDQPNCTTYS